MWRHTADAGDPADRRESALDVIKRCAGTRPRRLLLAGTLLLGLVAAVGVAVAVDPADRTLATLSDPTQSLMSVLVPYLGILMAGDLRSSPPPIRVTPTVTAAVLLAAVIGTFGSASSCRSGCGSCSEPWRCSGPPKPGSPRTPRSATCSPAP